LISHIGNMEVANHSTVVVYDHATGRIVHVHHCATAKGGKHPDRQTIERDALAHLAAAQPELTAKTAVLHVPLANLKSDRLYKVNTEKQELEELPKPPGRK
jgi:hypothetical protein